MKLFSILIVSATLSAGLHAESGGDRPADREAIRAEIDRIFQGFIHKDRGELRATHAEHWLGYLEGSRQAVHGVDGYMNTVGWLDGPYGMAGYKMREFDMIFHGDSAFVCFVADVDFNLPEGRAQRSLRITDFYIKENGKWIQAGTDTQVHPETLAEQNQTLRTLPDPMKKQLLDARERVWRAFFANDRAALDELIPAELLAINAGGGEWANRAGTMAGSEGFARSGAKLVSLEFPKTDIQCYGPTAIVYSDYKFETEHEGKRQQHSGRVTEVFVYRKGKWVNPGWHMDSGQ